MKLETHIRVPASAAGRVIGKGGKTVSVELGWVHQKFTLETAKDGMAQDVIFVDVNNTFVKQALVWVDDVGSLIMDEALIGQCFSI